jgi:hypothetical protein
VVTLTTSGKEIDTQDEQLKAAQKRQDIELLKNNDELTERVAKLEAVAQNKSSS